MSGFGQHAHSHCVSVSFSNHLNHLIMTKFRKKWWNSPLELEGVCAGVEYNWLRMYDCRVYVFMLSKKGST